MNTAAIMSKLRTLEAHADLIKSQVAVLKEELEGSGASTGSARKGKVSEQKKAEVLARRRKNKMKKGPQ